MNPYPGLTLLEGNRSNIESLCRDYGVVRLRVFGSSVRSEWNPDTSDFDFLVEFGAPPPGINLFKQQFGLQVALEKLLGRSVDLVDWNATKKPHFREIAEREALEWYAA